MQPNSGDQKGQDSVRKVEVIHELEMDPQVTFGTDSKPLGSGNNTSSMDLPNDEGTVGHEAPTLVVDDPEDFHDPMLNALWMLLEANATQSYQESLTLEER
ncbi:hypothetical protein Nepgr_018842 [Nepenthes gracilis]|uniref:Uncharacterized protein n=1 Tax=Nepenthes gracilis TaxID=150966 RepID=A0AAD3SVY8_NEPGR|nr:hypothetical protein Nepgr_018842 [Nepenthes gracilis]